jgi:hypothetical protein
MDTNTETEKSIKNLRQEKLYEAFKKHGIKRNNDAWSKLKDILCSELEKTTLEEVRINAWRVK